MKRDESGSALVEVVWLGILLMVPLVYVMLSVFDVQRGAFGVSAAALVARPKAAATGTLYIGTYTSPAGGGSRRPVY